MRRLSVVSAYVARDSNRTLELALFRAVALARNGHRFRPRAMRPVVPASSTESRASASGYSASQHILCMWQRNAAGSSNLP